ncbi:hypothetical protein [Streptomyces sp. DSM 41634]|uniref:hypothetical protein n=1 Tax=Streptomyces sp. DSM 41634 TaxID=3448656 RepID=UPI0028857145|nr:hypothetical protein [Streptomyces sp. DSM 41633]
MLLTFMAICVMLSLIVGGGAVALARWDRRTIPASIGVGFVAFAGTLTLLCGMLGLFLAARN